MTGSPSTSIVANSRFEREPHDSTGLGVGLSSVVRTRMFVTDISRWEEYGRAHGEVFGDHPPATTMVEVRALIEPEMLIEIEADAVTLEDGAGPSGS